MTNKVISVNNNLHYIDDIMAHYKHQEVASVSIYKLVDPKKGMKSPYSLIGTINYADCKLQDVALNSGLLNKNCYIDIVHSEIVTGVVFDKDGNISDQSYIHVMLYVKLSFNNSIGFKYICGSYSLEDIFAHYKQYKNIHNVYLMSNSELSADSVDKSNADIVLDMSKDTFDDAVLYNCDVYKKTEIFKYFILKTFMYSTIDTYATYSGSIQYNTFAGGMGGNDPVFAKHIVNVNYVDNIYIYFQAV